jgi:prepilin-type N-terminal cleavage/methylation domain-containing protein
LNARGFSLIESLIGLALLAVVLVSLLPAFLTLMDANTFSEEHSAALAAGQRVMERLRLTDPGSLPSTGSSAVQVVVVDGREFEVLAHYCRVAEYCSGETRHVTVVIRYGGHEVYDVDTVYTRMQH